MGPSCSFSLRLPILDLSLSSGTLAPLSLVAWSHLLLLSVLVQTAPNTSSAASGRCSRTPPSRGLVESLVLLRALSVGDSCAVTPSFIFFGTRGRLTLEPTLRSNGPRPHRERCHLLRGNDDGALPPQTPPPWTSKPSLRRMLPASSCTWLTWTRLGASHGSRPSTGVGIITMCHVNPNGNRMCLGCDVATANQQA